MSFHQHHPVIGRLSGSDMGEGSYDKGDKPQYPEGILDICFRELAGKLVFSSQ